MSHDCKFFPNILDLLHIDTENCATGYMLKKYMKERGIKHNFIFSPKNEYSPK